MTDNVKDGSDNAADFDGNEVEDVGAQHHVQQGEGALLHVFTFAL